MVAAAADGGGGDGFPHSTGRYDPGTIIAGGLGHTGGGPHSQSNLSQAGHLAMNASPVGLVVNLGSSLFGNGARDKVASALSNSDPETVKDHAHKWSLIATKSRGYSTQVSEAMGHLSSWVGDDADKARAVLQGLGATFNSASNASTTMSGQLDQMAATLKWAKDNWGDAGGVGSDVGNALSGGEGDDEAANGYQKMLTNFQTNMGYMPTQVPTEVKDDVAGNSFAPPPTPPPGGPVGPAPSAGGAGSAPHVGNPTPPHITQPPVKPPVKPPVSPPPPVYPPVEPPNPNLNNPGNVDYPGTGSSPYLGGGAGISPGVDTGGSLAGYDGSGAGGASGSLAGAGAGGDLPGGAGGVPGGGAGLGSGAGGGLGAGAGAGGGANGGLGSGAGGGVAGGAAGGRGMMPMHGGQNGDDDERERTTWLNEDDDVWGAEETLPGVIH